MMNLQSSQGWQQAERWFSVAVATRVNALLSMFFEEYRMQEDASIAIQVVESAWREASGTGDESILVSLSLEHVICRKLPEVSVVNP